MTSELSLVLVRHGETEWMERGRLHGKADSPLSLTGRRHAEQAAQRLRGERFDALYSSPLGRAMETARILGGAVGLTPQPVEGLSEFGFGWMEGAPEPLWHDGHRVAAVLRPVRTLIHWISGERPERFGERVSQTLEWMSSRHPGGRLLVVGHWAVFSRLLAVALAEPTKDWRDYGPWQACGISELRGSPSGANGRYRWQVVRLNDISHLQETDTR